MKVINMRRFIIYILFCIYCVGVNAQKLQKTDSGIIAETCGMVIEIDFYTPSIVRVMKYPVRTIPKKESLVVIKEKEKISWQLDSLSENELFLISNEVKVGYNRLTGKVSFFSINDLSLLNEKDYGTQFTKRHDGKECAYEVRQAFMLEPNEAIYGLGQHQKGLMNQRNQKLYLRQQNTEICIPFSSR